MIVKKYLHSCLLLESKGKKLLIDPGAFSFIEGKTSPADIGPVDIILFTHHHRDHYDPEALEKILSLKSAYIMAGEQTAEVIEDNDFTCERIRAGEVRDMFDFTIRAIEGFHEPLPIAVVENVSFVINETLLHPGDSYAVREAGAIDVLALPVAGPWALVDALEFARRLNPKTVIPIHDAGLKDFMLERVYANCLHYFERHGIIFHPMELGQVMEV